MKNATIIDLKNEKYHSFKIASPKKNLILRAGSKEDKMEWMEKLSIASGSVLGKEEFNDDLQEASLGHHSSDTSLLDTQIPTITYSNADVAPTWERPTTPKTASRSPSSTKFIANESRDTNNSNNSNDNQPKSPVINKRRSWHGLAKPLAPRNIVTSTLGIRGSSLIGLRTSSSDNEEDAISEGKDEISEDKKEGSESNKE